ncbi:MAG TPA: DEAD/DEAH box helicase [Acidimicrobiales bacterium]|nr:DEAD/DEAH box helicase [Acidimicrobiales bacterium]
MTVNAEPNAGRNAGVRAAVVGRLGFEPDAFQTRAFDALDAGHSVLVSAPTGSGKTAVADYAIARALAAGRKAFYTTPLKALSNQKFAELAAAYGHDQIGLLTGDVSHRPDAPVVVMTTEVVRNMLFARSPQLVGLGLLVLDEVHYLQDPYRGSVWEEAIIVAPDDVVLVCLSATVSNAAQLGAWVTSVHGPTDVITEGHRPVKLHNHVAVAEKGSRQVELLPLLSHGRLHPQAAALDQRITRLARRPGGLRHSRLATPRRTEIIDALAQRDMLPAIVFIFSRAACDDAVRHCLDDGLRLTSPSERDEIRAICEQRTDGLPEDELRVLGYGPWINGLEAGVASHHAGLIPAFREAVEECFTAGLLRVVFATETLSLGINMPARSVVIERLTKMRQHGRSGLTTGEYAQLTGRAGRRGLDSVGHAVVAWTPQLSLPELATLATSPPAALTSSFRATYNLAVNLVRRYAADQAYDILDRSFAQFLSTDHHSALSRRMDRALRLLERRGHVDLDAWKLTARGELVARIYHESDLLVAEALADGLFDGLDPAGLAAVVSACTYEVRAGRWSPEPRPPKDVAPRLHALVARAEDLRDDEEEAHLARTRTPDLGFAEVAWRWARGERLARVLERAELAPGDFVRNAKQLVDLLRQLATVAPDPTTAATAHRAATALQRGVVASSVGPPIADPETDETDPQGPSEGPEAAPGEAPGSPAGA